jgi:regulator of protease activity HflC (stomatin/prohibitin superfamily)
VSIRNRGGQSPERSWTSVLKILAAAAGLLIGLIILFSNVVTRVEVGNVGLRVNLAGPTRGVESVPIVTGWVWYNPFTEQIVEFPTRVLSVTWTRERNEGRDFDESITFASAEGLTVNADVGFAFHIEPSMAARLYTRFRQADINVLAHGYIRNLVRDALNEVASTMPVQDIYGAKKGELLSHARTRISEAFAQDGIGVDQLTFAASLRMPESVEQAINRTIEQTQAAISAQNRVAQVEAEAKQKIAQASGEAEAVLMRAKAEAEANRLLTQSLSQQLMEYKRLEKWDGKLPQVTGSGGIPMIQLGER